MQFCQRDNNFWKGFCICTCAINYVCTCAWTKPFPKIVPMAKLDKPTDTLSNLEWDVWWVNNQANLSILYPWFINLLVYFYSWKHSWMHIGPSLCNIKCFYEWSGCIFMSIFLTFPRVHYLKIIHGLLNKFVFPWVMSLASKVHLVWIFLH